MWFHPFTERYLGQAADWGTFRDATIVPISSITVELTSFIGSHLIEWYNDFLPINNNLSTQLCDFFFVFQTYCLDNSEYTTLYFLR